MKKLILLLALASIALTSFSQNVIEQIVQKTAVQIVLKLKTVNTESEIKIAVLNFALKNNYSDSIKTKTGAIITVALEQALQIEIDKRKINARVLTNNKTADELMELGTVVPNGVNEGDFWEEYLGNITPNYYISGAYEIVNNNSLLKLLNVKLIANKNQFNLKDVAIKNTEIEMKYNDKLYLLNFETSKNISQASKLMALQYKTQTKIKNIKLVNFVYAKNKLPSQFSDILATELSMQLVNTANYQVQRGNTRGRTNKTLHILSGTYLIEKERIKINSTLVNSETNMIVSTASVYVPLSYLKSMNINYEPENVVKIEKRDLVIKKDVIKNDFDINIWTNKGNDNVVFTEGDTLKLTVLAPEVCYIRLIYILADGSSVLLLDNYEIKSDNIQEAYQIPQQFVCAGPFGAETLILNAQTTEKFQPLKTTKQGGYDFISDDLSAMLNNSRRGFKGVVKHAEIFIHFITTK